MCEQGFNEKEARQEERKSGAFGCCLTLIIIVVSIALMFGLAQKSDSGGIFTRDAKITDIIVDVDYDFSLSVSLEVTPKVNIKDLQLTFEFLDSNGKVLTTKTKILGNVKKDTPYSVVFSLSEFSFSQLWKISGCRTSVTGGKV